uniref:Uncharacterized protein n=1 Tax=Arundo donax TaxID=35708 RepID=A0A0A8YNL1_ARUDO
MASVTNSIVCKAV